MMSKVGHLTIFLSHLDLNYHFVTISYYKHVYMLLPYSYGFVYSVFHR